MFSVWQFGSFFRREEVGGGGGAARGGGGGGGGSVSFNVQTQLFIRFQFLCETGHPAFLVLAAAKGLLIIRVFGPD